MPAKRLSPARAGLWLAIALSTSLMACGKKEAPPPAAPPPAAAAPAAPAPVPASAAPAPAPASAAASEIVGAAAASSPASAATTAGATPVASTDVDAPTPLSSREVKGQGLKKKLSYYYGFTGGPGTLKLNAVAKNAPSGSTNALTIGLYDARANRLCYETAGNTTTDKSFSVGCNIDKQQPLVLRLDLAEETIDYSVALEGPLELAPAGAAAAAPAVPAGPGSTDIDEPTKLSTNRIKGPGKDQAVSYYYAFNAGPGELTLTIDGRNKPAASTEALRVTLYTLRSERLCIGALGNTTVDKRAVFGCKVDKRQPVILRVDLSAESLDWRVRFEGPYDFEPFTPPKQVTIALDAAVLFDTAKFQLKPEAQQTLHEAADRIKKFADVPVMISGHTDNVGADAANQTLSEKRAQSVRDYLVAQEAVPAARLTAKGFGKSQPVAENTSDAGRARNRRVDVVIGK